MPRPEPADAPPRPAADAPAAPEQAGPSGKAQAAVGRFVDLVESHLSRASLERLVLAAYRGGEAGLQRIVARPLTLRGERVLSATLRYATRDVVKNLPASAAAGWLRETLGASSFGHAHLFAVDEEAQLLTSRKGAATLRRMPRGRTAAAPGAGDAAGGDAPGDVSAAADEGDTARPAGPSATSVPAPARAPAPAHDRAKRRHVDIAAPFLVALGVTDEAHRLIPAMARKWKQIDKFVELFEHALAVSRLADSRRVRVADFGAGKGYLTFAVHDHLQRAGMTADVVGVEWRHDLVDLCNDAAARLALDGLAFVQGDVRSHPLDAVDVMIALHACDTATDHALHRGIRAGAAVIMASPCCHKELRPQLLAPAPLGPLLRHGIHLGQQAEMVTDALRALLLEAEGYETQVFEFVSLEHTSKNKMILAVRRGDDAGPQMRGAAERRLRLRAQIDALMSFYGVREQALDRLLRQTAPSSDAAAPLDAAGDRAC